MSEYIPTTGVIRAGYQIARDTEDNLISFREFHSWLEQHDAEIVAKAEERIIKLLEDEEWHHIAFATRGPDDEPTKYHDGECLGCRLIALIKGEQK